MLLLAAVALIALRLTARGDTGESWTRFAAGNEPSPHDAFSAEYQMPKPRTNGRGQGARLDGMRWQLLCALRSLSIGAVLIMQIDPKTMQHRVIIFDGQRLPQLIGGALLEREWIQPLHPHWLPNFFHYGLSQSGSAALESGMRWWRTLPYHRRWMLRLAE